MATKTTAKRRARAYQGNPDAFRVLAFSTGRRVPVAKLRREIALLGRLIAGIPSGARYVFRSTEIAPAIGGKFTPHVHLSATRASRAL